MTPEVLRCKLRPIVGWWDMRDNRDALRDAASLSTVGITLVVCIALGAGGGMWLDKWLGTQPAFTVVGFLLGVVAGFIELFRATKPR